MTIFAVHYLYDPRSDARDQLRPAHRGFLAGLYDAGTLLASGPFTGPTAGGAGAGGEGAEAEGAMLLVRGGSAEDVMATLDADPFAVAGLVAARTMRPWNPVFGPWS